MKTPHPRGPGGEPILCIHPSGEVIGTVRSATLAARDFPRADIRVFDTQLIASPLATMVTLAAQWAEGGCEVDTIIARLRGLIGRAQVYFLVDTLRYLAMGGASEGPQRSWGASCRQSRSSPCAMGVWRCWSVSGRKGAPWLDSRNWCYSRSRATGRVTWR